MALIVINKDGSYEAVAASGKTPAQVKAEIKTLGVDYRKATRIAELKKQLMAQRGKVAEVKAKSGSKSSQYAAAVKKRDAIRDKIAEIKASLSVQTHVSRTVVSNKLKRLQFQASRHSMAKLANGLKATHVNGEKVKRTPSRTVTRTISFDTAAKKLARETNMGIRSNLRALDAAGKPAKKAKPVAAVTRHGTPKPGAGAAKQDILNTIKKIKADIAGGLKGSKLATAEAELRKNRAALRAARKGDSAANKAAVTPSGKASKAGMGGAKRPLKAQPGMGDASKAKPKSAKKEEEIRKLKNDIRRYKTGIKKLREKFGRHPNIGMFQSHLERAERKLATLK